MNDPNVNQQAYLEEGFIKERFAGEMTEAAVTRVATSADSLIEELEEKGEPVLFLIDLSQVTETNPAANNRAKHFLATRFFHKVAIFGLPGHLRVIANLVTKATGRADRIHYFPDHDQAVAWLRQTD